MDVEYCNGPDNSEWLRNPLGRVGGLQLESCRPTNGPVDRTRSHKSLRCCGAVASVRTKADAKSYKTENEKGLGGTRARDDLQSKIWLLGAVAYGEHTESLAVIDFVSNGRIVMSPDGADPYEAIE